IHDASAYLAFGLDPHDRDARYRAICAPTLRAIEHPTLVRAARARLHTGGIGPVIRFSETEAADLLAPGEERQPFFFLLFRSESEDRIHHQCAFDTHKTSKAAVAALQLLHDH